MKWDIDKALAKLESSAIAGTNISRVTMSGIELLEQHLGKKGLKAEDRARGYAHLQCLGLGKHYQRKLFFYGYTIHAAYLRARRGVRSLSSEELEFYGLAAPRRRKKLAPSRGKRALGGS